MQRDRKWPSKKSKPYGLRFTYDFEWAAWVSTQWHPTTVARESALRDLHKPGRWKSMPVKIERVERWKQEMKQ